MITYNLDIGRHVRPGLWGPTTMTAFLLSIGKRHGLRLRAQVRLARFEVPPVYRTVSKWWFVARLQTNFARLPAFFCFITCLIHDGRYYAGLCNSFSSKLYRRCQQIITVHCLPGRYNCHSCMRDTYAQKPYGKLEKPAMGGVYSATFWDHDTDLKGRAIREDVRQAAKGIWGSVCKTTRAVLGDDVEAAEILERCVARVSRYLDMHGAAMFTQNTQALLFVSFRRELCAVRKRRAYSVDISEYSDRLGDSTWPETIESRLDMQNLFRQLSQRSRTILILRCTGYEWKEVAVLLRTSVPRIKSSFWRELIKLKSKIAAAASSRPNDRKASRPRPQVPTQARMLQQESDALNSHCNGSTASVSISCQGCT